MADVFVVKCPDCDQPHRVGEQHRGKRIKCRGCETIIAIPAVDASEKPTTKAKAAATAVAKAKRTKPKAKRQPSDDENPYAAFEEDGYRGSGSDEVADDVIEELRKTKPWVRLVGFLGVIGLILTALGVAMSILGATMAFGGAGPIPTLALAIQTAALVLYFLVAKFLIGYSRSIGRLEESGSTEDLVSALAEQRRFWLLQGILIIIGLGIGLLAALFAIFMQVAPAAV